VLKVVDKIVQCYHDNAKKGERLGKLIERVGISVFKNFMT
jgi:dissimilatory sulfite reductase (desulfoviridin) alpha/beta subunit